MLFGRKKKDDAPDSAPGVMPLSPSPAIPVPAAPVAAPMHPAPAAAPAPAAGNVTVTPDYASARVIAANHLIVNAGQGKVIVDVARDLIGDREKQMPVDTRIVMTAQTARRLQAALEQALAKLG